MTKETQNVTPQDFPGAAAMKHLAELGVKATDITVHGVDTKGLGEGLPASVPIGWDRNGQRPLSLKSLIEEFRERPERRTGKATAQTLSSFIALTKRHMDEDSVVFANMDWKKPSFTAVLDYHKQAASEHEPRWLKHTIVYEFPLADDWQKWVKADGQPMAQGDFAFFIEDRIADLTATNEAEKELIGVFFPGIKIADPFEVLQLSRGLAVHVDSKVGAARNLTSGEAEITYTETHNDAGGNKLVVPGVFLIAVPVFYLGAPVRVPVRLRYRVGGGIVKWFFQMWRPDQYVTEQIKKDRDAVVVETGLPAFEGAPEA